MKVLKWDIEVSRDYEVTTNQFGWLDAEKTIFGINIKFLNLYIIGELTE
ncbi:uncharacterized protein METZ01_LOCUS200998 [marine metagenome]|uniref:Uncharacterized protein n=1 Tax=marine metagenome TaxID=408172 RepID=A0A382EDK6_9ZZZZ